MARTREPAEASATSPSEPLDAATDVVVVLCTAPDEATAIRLARAAVEARVAACVNVLGQVRSIYRWQGSVEDDAEVQLLFKTTATRVGALEQLIDREHPYDVAEFVVLPALGSSSAAYLAFVREQVKP